MICFKIGRWSIRLFDWDCIGYWPWKGYGYNGLWDHYGFGFLLQLERDTDYLVELNKEFDEDDEYA